MPHGCLDKDNPVTSSWIRKGLKGFSDYPNFLSLSVPTEMRPSRLDDGTICLYVWGSQAYSSSGMRGKKHSQSEASFASDKELAKLR